MDKCTICPKLLKKAVLHFDNIMKCRIDKSEEERIEAYVRKCCILLNQMERPGTRETRTISTETPEETKEDNMQHAMIR